MAKQTSEVEQAGAADVDQAQDGGREAGQRRPAVVHTGNPRITVAFPFARIETREPSEAVSDLAALVLRLAEHVDAVTRQLAPDQAEASEVLAADARLLAIRLGASP